jgi:hypothetical protein
MESGSAIRAITRRAYRSAAELYRSPRLRQGASAALFVWFAYQAWLTVRGLLNDWPQHLDTIGVDGRLYYRAAAAWLSGGDPWTAYTTTNTWPPSGALVHFLFTGPPPTVIAFVPFLLIPEDLFVVGWMALSVACAVYITRRLGLPVWWALFPPLVSGIAVGNPHTVALALLLSGSTWLQSLAAPVKAYAAIPMVGERQWRAIAVLVIGVGASVILFWPLWSTYLRDYSQIQNWLIATTYGGYSATRDPRLFALAAAAIGALALVDLRAAGWLAVPALWPGTQYFYASFAMPVRSGWLAFVLAASGERDNAWVPWSIIAYCGLRILVTVAQGAWAWRTGASSVAEAEA